MWTIAKHKNWKDLQEGFDWVRDMDGVPQDAVHHAEGDVAIHTQMVLEALQGLDEYKALPVQEQEIVWAAALLHDVEKRSTTVHEADGSITSKGHAKKGAMTTRQLLYTDIPTPFSIREQVVNLIRYHGLPIWAIEKENAVKAVIEASMVADTRLLALLAKADALGRICTDKEDLLYRIGLFGALCMEHGCWGKPRHFETAGAKFNYFYKQDSYPDFVPFDDYGSQVVMLSGLPGAGKDTYVSKHYKDWPVINLDAIRREMKVAPTDKSGNGTVIQMAKEQARQYLRKKERFIWNATNITKAMREQLVESFVTYKAFVTIVYIEVPYRMLHKQNSSREAMIPINALDKLITKLEVPAPWEAHEVVYAVKS